MLFSDLTFDYSVISVTVRNHGKVESVLVYVNGTFNLKLRTDLSGNSTDKESLSMQILFDKRCNTLFSVLYKPPIGL